jgi:hypothetical protein
MMTLEYGGQEKSLGDWGLSADDASLSYQHLAADVFTVGAPGRLVSDAALFPYEAWVTVRQGRSWVAGAWTGGSIVFKGVRGQEVVDGRPTFEGCFYQFLGPAYYLESSPFQQTVYTYTGDPDNPTASLTSDVLLFQKVTAPGTGISLHTGLQITEIAQYVLDECTAAGVGAPYQLGTIGVQVNLPTYFAQDPTCMEAIEYCLRCSPDAVLWFDYSFDPPKLNVTKRADATAAAITLADGTTHEGVRIIERPDLTPRAVIIRFRRTNTVNGITWAETVVQKYGPNGANSSSDPNGGHRVIIQTVDLQGVQSEYQQAQLQVRELSALDRWWWAKFMPWLKSKKVRNFGFVGSPAVTDEETDAAVDLDVYPNVLVDGQVADWMKLNSGDAVVTKRVRIQQECAYKHYDVDGTGGTPYEATNGRLLEEYLNRRLCAEVTLTNAPAGTPVFTNVESFLEEEAIPSGMAQSIFTALSEGQYAGTVTVVEEEVSSTIQPGKNKLNLNSGRAWWATMNAQITGVTRDFGTGRTTVTVGPARWLAAGDLTQLFLINRQRYAYQNASSRTSGQFAGRNEAVKLGKALARQDTTGELPNRKSLLLSTTEAGASATEVHVDAGNQRVLLRGTDGSGTPDATAGQILISLADADGKDVKLRWLKFKDYEDDCAEKRILVLSSEPEAVP